MVEYYAYSIYHGQAAALGGRDRTHGLVVGAFKQSCANDSHNEPTAHIPHTALGWNFRLPGKQVKWAHEYRRTLPPDVRSTDWYGDF